MPGGFRDVGRRVSNRGRWGVDDQVGTLNLIVPAHRAAAAALARTGISFGLALPLDAHGPQRPEGARQNPIHMMTRLPSAPPGHSGFHGFDDALFLYPQCATHVDALAHVAYDGFLYNRVPTDEIVETGARRLGVQEIGARLHGRGVLLDLPRLTGRARLEGGEPIGVADLEAAEAAQGVRVGTGDLLLIRTGWITVFTVDLDREAFHATEPGLDLGVADWLDRRGVAFVASDNWGIEVVPAPSGDELPLHCVLIRDMGMPLGEMFDLEQLAGHAAATGTWEFHLACPILPITGGTGSPVAPIVTF
jgi:kynurenine formamidase